MPKETENTSPLVICEPDGTVLATTTAQVVASMALQTGLNVYSNVPTLNTTQEFICWAENNQTHEKQGGRP